MNIEPNSKNATWKTYEEVATYLLNCYSKYFGLDRVEGKQKINQYEIDAKGIREGNTGFVIVECKRYENSKPNQSILGNLAWQIVDTGAYGGIIVSPLGIQKGAELIANKKNIFIVTLNADCTAQEFTMKFLNKLMIGLKDVVTLGDSCSVVLYRKCNICNNQFKVIDNEKTCPVCQGTTS